VKALLMFAAALMVSVPACFAQGTFTRLEGKVEVQNVIFSEDRSKIQSTTPKLADTISEGHVVLTGDKSTAQIEFKSVELDGESDTIMDIEPNSAVQFLDSDRTILQSGKLHVSVKQKTDFPYVLSTANAEIWIIGEAILQIEVKASTDTISTWVKSERGTVSVNQMGAIPGQPSSPVAVLNARETATVETKSVPIRRDTQ
jgi:ferric-dicitrate binding protein FerR (iron transport regulator)